MGLLGALLDLFAPPRCVICGGAQLPDASPFCLDCLRRLPWWRLADGCPLCGIPLPALTLPELELFVEGAGGCPGCLANGSPLHACHALLRYEGPARVWIPGFKRVGGPFGPPPVLSTTIAFLANELARRPDRAGTGRPDHVVPVPLHPRRRRERGLDHAAWIARRIARAVSRPCRVDALRRVRASRPQASLGGPLRRENVRGAFRGTRRFAPGSRVWLVDDVLTTGHTLESAAEALLACGAEEVHALTLAATLPARRRVGWAPERSAT